MTFKFVYDMPYVKNMIHYILIPIFVLIIVTLILTFIYSKKCKDHNDYKYQYKMNILVIVFSLLLISLFFAILLAYAGALRNYMRLYDFTSTICKLVLISPIIPFIFLIYLLIKLVKTIDDYSKEKKKENVDPKLSNIDDVVVPKVAFDYKEPQTDAPLSTEPITNPSTEVLNNNTEIENLTNDNDTEVLSNSDDIEKL